MTKPQSFPVLLQLPRKQLEVILEASPDIKNELVKHVGNLTYNQRSHIPNSLMQLIEGDAPKDTTPQADATEDANSDKRKRKIDISKESGKDKKKKVTIDA